MSFSIIITTAGDRAVGLNGDHVECHFEGYDAADYLFPKGDREQLRASTIAWAKSWCDGRPGVRFSDECPDCGKIMSPVNTTEGGAAMECRYPGCISRRPSEEPSSCETKTLGLSLGDLLTDDELARCLAIYRESKPGQFANRCAEEVINPVIDRIDAKTLQKNVPLFISYVVESVILKSNIVANPLQS